MKEKKRFDPYLRKGPACFIKFIRRIYSHRFTSPVLPLRVFEK